MADHHHPRGVGLAYRACIHDHVMRNAARIDLLEIPTEDYIIRRRRLFADPQGSLLREAVERLPCVAHGISMSIGSVEPFDRHYLQATRNFLEEYGLQVFSEHLAFHRMDGADLAMFLCMPFEEVSIEWLKRKYAIAREALGRPFGLENVSYYFPVPGSGLDEAEFLTRLLKETDCTLLLDVTNVFNNASNHGYDPVAFIRRLPGDRISQLHLAGGHYSDGMWQDSHSAPVVDEVWDLLHEALAHTQAEFIILERDSDFQPFDTVMRDIEKARSIYQQHRPAAAKAGVRRSTVPPPPSGAAPKEEWTESKAIPAEFADLRGFQRALLREIMDPAFARRARSQTGAAGLGMNPSWEARWRGCDRKLIKVLADKWNHLEKDLLEEDEQYSRAEWQAWAAANPR